MYFELQVERLAAVLEPQHHSAQRTSGCQRNTGKFYKYLFLATHADITAPLVYLLST